MAEILSAENLIALATLTTLEVVLGIDNIVFIAILTGKLEGQQRDKARHLGLILAMGVRILLLLGIGWVTRLTTPLFSIAGQAFAGRHLIFLAGGLFLVAKSTYEIHDRIDTPGPAHPRDAPPPRASFSRVIGQIVMLDIVFSLDSVITAVGMARALWVMITAVVIAVLVMLLFAGHISRFIERHPTLKMLALAFLLLIGVMLLVEAFDRHIAKGYIYFAMAFSLGVELLNIKARQRRSAKKHSAAPE